MRMLLGVEDGIDETVVVGEAVAEALDGSGWVKVIDTTWTEMALEPKGGTAVDADWFTATDEDESEPLVDPMQYGRDYAMQSNVEARLAIAAEEEQAMPEIIVGTPAAPKYVIHQSDSPPSDHGRQVSRVPEHLTMSEFQSNPDRYQFAVGTITYDNGRPVLTLEGAACPIELRGTRIKCHKMAEVRAQLALLQP